MTDLKLSPPPYDNGFCCISRCRAESEYVLGPESSFPMKFGVKHSLGICQTHWERYTAEPPKAASAAIKKMSANRTRKKAALVQEPELVEEEELGPDEYEEEEIEDEEEYEAEPPRKKRKMQLRIRRRA